MKIIYNVKICHGSTHSNGQLAGLDSRSTGFEISSILKLPVYSESRVLEVKSRFEYLFGRRLGSRRAVWNQEQ